MHYLQPATYSPLQVLLIFWNLVCGEHQEGVFRNFSSSHFGIYSNTQNLIASKMEQTYVELGGGLLV